MEMHTTRRGSLVCNFYVYVCLEHLGSVQCMHLRQGSGNLGTHFVPDISVSHAAKKSTLISRIIAKYPTGQHDKFYCKTAFK